MTHFCIRFTSIRPSTSPSHIESIHQYSIAGQPASCYAHDLPYLRTWQFIGQAHRCCRHPHTDPGYYCWVDSYWNTFVDGGGAAMEITIIMWWRPSCRPATKMLRVRSKENPANSSVLMMVDSRVRMHGGVLREMGLKMGLERRRIDCGWLGMSFSSDWWYFLAFGHGDAF